MRLGRCLLLPAARGAASHSASSAQGLCGRQTLLKLRWGLSSHRSTATAQGGEGNGSDGPQGSEAAPASAAAAACAATQPAPAAPPPASEAAADPENTQLGTGDLEHYIQQHGIQAAVVPPLNGAPPPPGCVEVKSLVFVIDNQPVVLVLPLAARVDERRLAALLHTGRNRVRLAPPGSLVELCGYTIGNVPPFGHRRRLPTLVDSSVTAFERCYAGGGSDGAEILLAVDEMVQAASATIADIAAAPREPAGGGAGDDAAAEAERQQRQAAVAAAAAALPLPWQPGQVEVELEGVVAHRRKIARLLLFANLVPLEPLERAAAAAPAVPKPGTAAYMRRLWRHPDTQQPTEVQLIMGRTLELRLGSEPAAELLRSIRTGQSVRVKGRVQPHPAPPGESAHAKADVCDVIVSHIELVDRPAPLAASASASGSSSAEGPAAAAAAAAGAAGQAAARAAACYQLPAGVRERVLLVDSQAGLDQLEAALFPSGDPVTGSSNGASTSSGSDNVDGPDGTMSEAPALAGGGGGAAGVEPRGFGPAAGPFRLVVGLDAEWQPYSSRLGDAPTPVSLLQLATPAAVFLVDMLALCSSGGSGGGGGSRSSDSGGTPAAVGNGSEGQVGGQPGEAAPADEGQALSPAERRLSGLLLRLFGDAGIVKAGFGLSTDLTRLCDSYPHLPCFGADGPVPLRSHVDVLLLARTALGPALPHARRRVSLAALAEAVLGVGLDKAEQCSAWGSRPLRPEQLEYAAADAHALVALHHALLLRRAGLDSPFWVSHFSGKLTDVAAFHPRARGRRGSSSSSSGVRRSAVSWRERRALQGADALPAGGGSRAGRNSGGNSSRGQTQQLDVNVQELLTSYLGRQLPQGGKAAVVRACVAHTGRPESGRTPSFPRGCGGLLEWRNAFVLFVNLPDPTEPAGGRTYANEFLWLHPSQLGEQEAEQARQEQQAQRVQQEAQQQRLYMTWWPGRGQSAEHPVVQRLVAAGRAAAAATGCYRTAGDGGTATAPADAAGGFSEGSAASSGRVEDAGAGGSAIESPQQAAVLLFCRQGAGHYIFCGRLALAAVGAGDGGEAGSWLWELADSNALLSGEDGGAFQAALAAAGGKRSREQGWL